MRLRVFVRIISISIDGFQTINLPADVAELADALASGASGGNPVEVQILSSALLGLFPEDERIACDGPQQRSWQAIATLGLTNQPRELSCLTSSTHPKGECLE